jgi:maltose O-acetyltransferase
VSLPATTTGVREALRAVGSFARARYELRGATLGARVRCYGRMLVDGSRGIEVASRTVFLGGMFPTELVCADGAEIRIGPNNVFNYGVSIVAHLSVRIGAGCRFGSAVYVRDDDGHSRAPVVIDEDVWIAHGAILEPGAWIGRGSVVAAGAVVAGHVPPGMLAMGNPAAFAPLGSTQPILPAPLQTVDAALASRTSPQQVRTAIIDWLDDTRHFGEAAHLIPSDAASLRDAGLLDSLGLVQLVIMLEKRFGVRIDRKVVARRESQSLRAIVDLVVEQPSRAP